MWTIGSLIKPLKRITFHYLSLTKCLIILLVKKISFLDGFDGYNQIQISPEDQDKTTFTCPCGTFAYSVLPFGLCNAPSTFERAMLGIFSNIATDCVEIYMDDFTTHGTTFEEAQANLEKVLKICQEYNLSLNSEKCYMMMEEGVVLGHYLSSFGIQVDPAKIAIINTLPTPVKQKDVRSFLGHAIYYRRFIKDFNQLATPLYNLLKKEAEFEWTKDQRHHFSN